MSQPITISVQVLASQVEAPVTLPPAGPQGARGWSPVLAVETDGARRVARVVGWTGGQGVPPEATGYLGVSGLVATAAEAVDIRGAEGAPGEPGAPGAPGTTSWAGITDKPSTFAPSAHAASHASDGGDPLTPAAIGAEAAGAAATAVAAHAAAVDPHPQYATDAELAAHTGNTANPHGTTAAQVGADPAGTAAAAVSAHAAGAGVHSIAGVTGLQTALDGKAASSHTHPIADLPVASSGVSSSTQVVRADDSRLSDARPPTAHTHTASQISDSGAAGRSVLQSATAEGVRAAAGVPASNVRMEWWDDFLNTASPCAGGLLSGSVGGFNSVSSIGTGTTNAANQFGRLSSDASALHLGHGIEYFCVWVNTACSGAAFDGVSSSGRIDYGFGDHFHTATPDATDGCYFRHVNAGPWECITRSAGSETATPLGISDTSTRRTFAVLVNSTATSVQFFVGGVLVATHTTNIPTNADRWNPARTLGVGARALRVTASAATTVINADAFYLSATATSERWQTV